MEGGKHKLFPPIGKPILTEERKTCTPNLEPHDDDQQSYNGGKGEGRTYLDTPPNAPAHPFINIHETPSRVKQNHKSTAMKRRKGKKKGRNGLPVASW